MNEITNPDTLNNETENEEYSLTPDQAEDLSSQGDYDFIWNGDYSRCYVRKVVTDYDYDDHYL